MKKLWIINVEYELIVEAEDEKEALYIGKNNVGEDGSPIDYISASEITNVDEIPPDWKNALPFGTDTGNNKTCLERLENIKK